MLQKDKEETIEYYDTRVLDYEESKKNFIEDMYRKYFDHFIDSVKKINGKKILDLGSGPGRDGLLFKKEGFHPVCVDLSESMINRCKEHGLESYMMDFHKLDFPDNSFDAVWASFSLIHTTKKELSGILSDIKRILKPNGIFMISVFEGTGEGMRVQSKDKKRYFAYYKEEEMKDILERVFEIIFSGRIPGDSTHPAALCFECINNK